MIPARLLPHTVQWSRPGVRTDPYGDTVEDWSSPIVADVVGRMTQRRTREVSSGKDVVVSTWVLFTNTLGIKATHRITYGGTVYEVDGDPLVATDISSAHHAEVALKKVG